MRAGFASAGRGSTTGLQARCDGLTALLAVNGAINGERFLAYVENVLVPTLKPGDCANYFRHDGYFQSA